MGTHIHDLPAITAMTTDDLLVIENSPGGTPETSTITYANFFASALASLNAELQGIVEIDVFLQSYLSPLVVGDAQAGWYYEVGQKLAGYNVIGFSTRVVTAGTTGTTDLQLRRVRSGVSADVCSTKSKIDSAETTSRTGTTAVIDTANDDLLAGDYLFVDLDAIPTTAPLGLFAKIEMRKP